MAGQTASADAGSGALAGSDKKKNPKKLRAKLSTIDEGDEVDSDGEPKTYEVFGDGDEGNDLTGASGRP